MSLDCYVVTYDISSPKRWRQVYSTMLGFGEHIQLSVFRCDLTPVRLARLRGALDRHIHHDQDQVLIVKLGRSGPKAIREIEVLGRPRSFVLPAAKIL